MSVIKLGNMGSFSGAGSAFTCYRAMLETGATAVLAVGIAFGIDESKQSVGDVLVSEALHLYDDVTVRDDGDAYHYEYPPHAIIRASPAWIGQFQRAAAREPTGSEPRVRVHFGRLLAGGARIESRRFRDELCVRVGDGDTAVIGGEMEAAGVAAACVATSAGWAAVKSVSDFATSDSRGRIAETRDIAANNAAKFALKTLALAPELPKESE